MRRFVLVVIAGFAAVLALCAGEGVPPRASAADYPVHRDAQDAMIAAGPVAPELVKKIFPPEVNKNFVVMEIAVFPLEGQTAYVDAFDFDLKFSADEVSYPRSPDEIVAMWLEKNAPQPPDKVAVTAETGVVYTSGNDPATGRSHGWGTLLGRCRGPGPANPAAPAIYRSTGFRGQLAREGFAGRTHSSAGGGISLLSLAFQEAQERAAGTALFEGRCARHAPDPGKVGGSRLPYR